jgi:rSAM/selenodomain-associated transferase 1
MTAKRGLQPVSYPDGRLLIFAKAPVPGQVKTRLMPFLDGETCARLQQWLIERVLKTATEAALCPIELWCAPDGTHPFFGECARTLGVETRVQRGLDLGLRMHHALSATLAHAPFALIIGCDCPPLNATYLTRACEALANGFPVVLGPAEDGGYVLIGARSTAARLFEDIAWGSSVVLDETRERLRYLGWGWCELEPLWDVDRPADLWRLSTENFDASGAYSANHSRHPPAISG